MNQQNTASNPACMRSIKPVLKGTVLDHFYFKELHQGWEVEEFYVTNLRITK